MTKAEPHPGQEISVPHSNIEFDTPTTPNAPLPDFEKSSLAAPPAHSHPAYHSLPSRCSSPQIPSYAPGRPIPSPPMTQHPAYHLSNLSSHPAFCPRPSVTLPLPKHSPSKNSRRKETFLRRNTTNMLDDVPISFTPVFQSPISGRSELEAEVPREFVTPSHTSLHSAFLTQSMEDDNSISRGNTKASTYSIPIGLGVGIDGESSREHGDHEQQQQMSGPKGPSLNSRYTFNVFPTGSSHSETTKLNKPAKRTEARSMYLNATSSEKEVVPALPLPRNSTLHPTTSLPSLSEYERGNAAGRWSGSTYTSHSHRDTINPTRNHRMSELPATEKIVGLDELTPLSQVYRESWSDRASWCLR